MSPWVYQGQGHRRHFPRKEGQQAVEKPYKALIAALGRKYEFTHDLFFLRKQLEQKGEVLPDFVPKLEQFTSFAGQFRYEQAIHLDDP